MSHALRDQATWSLDWARRCTLDVLEGFPEEHACFRTGDADNHLLWTLGHIALSDEWILKMLTGEESPLPEAYGKLFGYQSEVTSDADAYPPLTEVRRHFESSRQRLLDWLAAADDHRLNARMDDGGSDFAKTALEAVTKEAWHEGWHAGQLSTLRRALGMAPAFG